MPGKAFLDTNVLVCAVAENDPRSPRAEELLETGGVIGVQNLNEFASVARKKMEMAWADVNEAIEAFRILCPEPIPVTVELHDAARKIAEKRGYGIYDALVIAAALEAGCETLYSEDFQDGQVIEGRLRIRNPFRSAG